MIQAPIKSVTVFKSSKAEVVRTVRVNLQKGQNKLQIKGLSSTIDTHSVRISGLGDARLFDVVTTIKGDDAETYSPTSSSEVIRKLDEKIRGLQAAIKVTMLESSLHYKYGETLTGQYVTPDVMTEFLDYYQERENKTLEANAEMREEILQLQRQMAAEKEKASSKRGAAHGHVAIVIVADHDSSVELKLTYIVSGATWRPTYELHAATENGKPSSLVELHYRARVTQSTGEDWNNASLTLSTVSSDTIARVIPALRPVTLRQPTPGFRPRQVKAPRVGPVVFVSNNIGPGQQKTSLFGMQQQQQQQQVFQQQQQQQVSQQQPQTSFGALPKPDFGSQTSSQGPAFSSFGSVQPQPAFGTGPGLFGTAPLPSTSPAPSGAPVFGAPPPAVGPESVEEEFEEIEGPTSDPITIVTETPMAISFSVHGESNIPSDGTDHQVSVAMLPFSAAISYVTIPRIDPRVFLQCEVKNTSEYRLLPGPVTVILDDSYVSKTFINDVNTGDNFRCTLGDDASAKVTYERTSKTVKSDGGTFSEVTNTTTHTTKISIHNKHQFAIKDLIVRDVISTCDDKRVKIVLRKPKGLADAKDGEWVGLNEDGLRVGWERLIDGKGGEKEGKFEWSWKVDNGAKVNLEAEWEIKAPGEFAWVETF